MLSGPGLSILTSRTLEHDQLAPPPCYSHVLGSFSARHGFSYRADAGRCSHRRYFSKGMHLDGLRVSSAILVSSIPNDCQRIFHPQP
jgi:hypothetical protein